MKFNTIKIETPKYSVSCLICNKTIGIYDYPITNKKVCEDCKKAIAYVKRLMEAQNERI